MVDFELFIFFVIGFLAWFLGSVAAGGAGLVFMVASSFLIPLPIIPIILACAGSLSGAYRFILYRSFIQFDIAKWLLVGTVLGTILGTHIFASVVHEGQIYILESILAFVLMLSGIYGLCKPNSRQFQVQNIYFLPFSLFTAILSSIIGVGSPLINILFQRTDLKPVEIFGTKSFSNFILQLSKLMLYAYVLSYETVAAMAAPLGLHDVAGVLVFSSVGALAGSFFGKRYLDRLDIREFDWIINVSLIVFGGYFLVRSSL